MAIDLEKLAQAFRDRAPGPVGLNAAFLQSNGATPPEGFDTALTAAFLLTGTAGLSIRYQQSGVGPVANNRFQITGAQLADGFLGAAAPDTTAKLTFADEQNNLVVQGEVGLAKWTFGTFFTFMTGWPFDLVGLASPTFVFSTAAGSYSWQAGNATIPLRVGQNFAAVFTPPAALQPVVALASGVNWSAQLPAAGPIVLDKADNNEILFPDMSLSAPLTATAPKVFFLTIKDPALGLAISSAQDTEDGETTTIQTPELFFASKIEIELVGGGTTALDLKADLMQEGNLFTFGLTADPAAEVRITPATLMAALTNNQPYFELVPPQLQSFFTTVGFEGLTLSGSLPPNSSLSSLSLALGSGGKASIVLISDPLLEITSLDLVWTVLNPLNTTIRQNLVQFTTTFKFWTDVFDGEFEVSINQQLDVDAAFNGSVSLDALLKGVTGGAIGTPNGVSVTFSDVALSIHPSARTYSFGLTTDLNVDLITWTNPSNGQTEPLIQVLGAQFALSATTPAKTDQKARTIYQASLDGVMVLGPVMLATHVAYDGGAAPPTWRITTGLARPLNLHDLLAAIFNNYDLPSFVPDDLSITAFEIDATIPTKSSEPNPPKSSYKISGTLVWDYDGLPGFPIHTKADLGLSYDGNRPAGEQFSGSVIGEITLDAIGADVMIGYQFGPAAPIAPALARAGPTHALAAPAGNSQVLWVQWEGARAAYDITNQTLTFTLNGWTVGKLIEKLVGMLGDPYFTLPSPWDLLNQISLDGLKVVIDLKPNVQYRVSIAYALPKPINLGFLTINGLTFRRQNGKVTLAIDGTTSIPGLQQQPLFNPQSGGQDVKQMPQVPGRGNALFELKLLALGQRVGIRGAAQFNSTKAVIDALAKIPATTDGSNPVDPSNPTPGQPYYAADRNWLVAADFGLLRVGPVYTFEAMVVFTDPDLYGLRLAFNGDKAKVLAGLTIDILYKKISDDVGVYQIEFSFPNILRNLDFGAFSITLPNIGIQIYTNGDFFFNFGFPYNLDFSVSFSVQAIIYGVPVLGSAGFYFGKLSSATTTVVPQTTKGTFDPVIVFGLGVQVGVGRYFEKGPLKAGFSITVFGIIEGVIAAWHPYTGSAAPARTDQVQGDYYFWLQGSFGVIGKLYGTVDFAIIKADVQLLVKIVAQITYESYRAIPLSLTASVSIKVPIKIDLGLFSISISFSFSTSISVDLTIGTDQYQDAPWYDGKSIAPRLRRNLVLGTPHGWRASRARLTFRPLARVASAVNPTLTLTAAPQFTVLAPPGGGLADQQGAFVFLLAMDAPTIDGPVNQATSFEALCAAFLPWVIDALKPEGAHAHLTAVLDSTVSRDELQAIIDALADTTPPISADAITGFLKANFVVNVVPPTTSASKALQSGATIFPPFPGFSLTIPSPTGGTGSVTIALGEYVTVNTAYREQVAAIFRTLVAQINEESGTDPTRTAEAADPGEPLSQFVFEDYFLLIARQLVQAAEDALDDYTYALQPGDSLASVLGWAQKRGNPDLHPLDVAEPNLDHSLTGGNVLSLTGLIYTTQGGDTLTRIAVRYSDPSSSPRWSVAPATLILTNPTIPLRAEISVAVGANTYVTGSGDSLQKVADELGITLPVLATVSSLYGVVDLFVPTTVIAVPTIAYTTASGQADSLRTVLQRFDLPLTAFAANAANQAVANLFDATAEPTIRIANLKELFVSDLWEVIRREEQVVQVAGMVARFQLHGLRLPNEAGLSLPNNFLYPPGQVDYGLYQLTGQQFPTPSSVPTTYTIALGKDTSLSWVEFAGQSTNDSLPIDLSAAAGRLGIVLAYATSQGYDPTPTLTPQADVSVTPKRFSVQSSTLWSTSDLATLAAVTAPPALRSAGSSQPQAQPILWDLPDSLLREVARRQSALARFPLTDALRYLPAVGPEVGTTDPANRHTSFVAVEDFAFATRIQFQIKKLAQADDPAPPHPDANDVVPPGPGNTGSQARPLAPNNFELIGPGPAEAVLLQRLLTAMDALGTSIVSGLFLLYPNSGTATTGLVSRGGSEFLSFITQTNLSTETNPAGVRVLVRALGDQSPPRGVVDPVEFLKLLWELSTVRSGGYYLYYQILDGGATLPEALFDSDGAATLTLVVTYGRSGNAELDDGRLLNTMNALVTTQAIDRDRSVMTLLSRSKPVPGTPLAGGETLDQIADLYGMGVGALAALNSTRDLVAGNPIPISGAYHQLTAADLTQSNPLESVAAYYSRNAQVPLSGQAVANFNSGVTVTLGAVFRIPPVVYVVSPDPNGPGTQFATMAAYYRLPTDALASLARPIPGLFPKGDAVTIDPIDYDVQPALGLGNLGIDLTRANLGPPPDLPASATPAEKATYAKATLFSLYSLLSAGLDADVFFNPSPQGIPFGPTKPVAPEESLLHRRAATRRAVRAALDDSTFDYAQAIGFVAYAKVNAAPDPVNPNLPPKATNPYIGVGSIAQVGLRWLDVFGNVTVTPFSAPPPGYAGPLNGLPVPLDYSDRLIGPSLWPNVQITYVYSGTPTLPTLRITFELAVAAYNPPPPEAPDVRSRLAVTGIPQWQQSAQNDLKTFTKVYFQLEQNYEGLNIAGLSGRAVSMSLTNTLLATPETPLADSQAAQIRGFVSDCVVYVARRAVGQPGGVAPTASLTLDVPLSVIATANIIELSVSLTLARQAALCDPALRAIPGGLSVTSTIFPMTDAEIQPPGGAEPPPVELKAFAEAMETVFDTPDWRFRVGIGTAAPDDPSGSRSYTVWAVRMAAQPGGAGLGYRIDPLASFYAPEPVARELYTGTTAIGRYVTGKPFPDGDTQTMTFTGVDLNAWAQTALAAIDGFLSATFTAPAFILDRMVVPNDPSLNGYLAKILAHKETLADAISRTVKPILSTSRDDDATSRAARDKLHQQLLNELSSAFTVTAVTVFSVTGARYRDPLGPSEKAPPRFYGQPQGTTPAQPTATPAVGEQNYSLSTARIPLTLSNGNGDSRLAFLFNSKNVTDRSYVQLALSYAMSHLEHEITNVPGIKGYEQSLWISFVNGPFVTPIGEPIIGVPTPIDFPVVLRTLPTPPTMTGQTATAVHTNSDGFAQPQLNATPADLAEWNYIFSYLYGQNAQDSITATIELNHPADTLTVNATPDDDLFQALAQFVSVEQEIGRDLETFLRKINGNTLPGDDVTNAKYAVAAFEAVVAPLAAAYDAWAKPRVAFFSSAPAQTTYTFDIRLTDDDGDARVDVIKVVLTPDGAVLHDPIILIDPAEYDYVVVTAPDTQVAYKYKKKAVNGVGDGYLSYDSAHSIPQRTVKLPELNVFVYQNAWSSAQVVRNQFLVPDKRVTTTPTFQFRTPEVKFADLVVPLLDYPFFDLNSINSSPTTLEDSLDAFFSSLLRSAEGQQVLVSMQSMYSYQLAPTLLTFPRTTLPIDLLPPTPVTYTPDQPPSFISALATDVLTWQERHQPPINASSQFNFSLSIFAGQNSTISKPLVIFRNIYLNILSVN